MWGEEGQESEERFFRGIEVKVIIHCCEELVSGEGMT